MKQTSKVDVSLAEAHEQKKVSSLMTPYLLELGASPDYPFLAFYWSDRDRFPYLFRKEPNDVIGFALVRRLPETGRFEIAEFYVVPSQRRTHSGSAAFGALLRLHPGGWSLSVLPTNQAALNFWRSAIKEISGQDPEIIRGPEGKTIFNFSYSSERCDIGAPQ